MEPRPETEGVVGHRFDEHPADDLGVAGVGERPLEQPLDLAPEGVERLARRRKPHLVEEGAKLGQREGPHVGRVAELLHPVQRGGLLPIGRGDEVDDHDASARDAGPHHLRQDRPRLGEMVKGEARADDREGAVAEREREHLADRPAHVADALLLGERTGARDHRGRQVDARDTAGDACEGAYDQSGAAGHVEHRVVRGRAGGLGEERQGLLVPDAGRRRERDRLPGELLEDQVTMRRHGRSSTPAQARKHCLPRAGIGVACFPPCRSRSAFTFPGSGSPGRSSARASSSATGSASTRCGSCFLHDRAEPGTLRLLATEIVPAARRL